MSTEQVIVEIHAERRRQVEREEWSADHDDQHKGGQLAAAAACYALGGRSPDVLQHREAAWQSVVQVIWPWEWKWWKPKNRRRDLIRAAALIVAEIERLDRAEAAEQQ